MANIKITQLPTATTIGDNDLIPVVTGIGGTPVTGHITKFDFAATIASSPIDTNPVENTYSDIATMLADQSNQTTNYFNYVIDASADTNVLVGDAYYEKKSSSTTTLSTDYRLLSDTEVTVVTDSNSYRVFKIQAIQDEGTPLTTVGGGRISFEFNGANVTAILFNARYSKTVLEFYNKDVNVRFYNRTTQIYQTESVASTAWTTVNTDFYRAEVTGTNIQIADLTVNDRVEFFIVEASATSNVYNLEYQTAITTNTTLDGTQKGLNKVYPVDNTAARTITITTGDYVENDVINIERRGQGTVEVIADTDVFIRGVRDVDNRYFINDVNSLVSVLCRGSEEFGIIGNLKRGYTGKVVTISYGGLQSSETVDVPVTGTGFSANMLVSLSGNATLNSWTYVNNNNITLNITSSGTDGDYLDVTYDNGDVYVDEDAIQLTDVAPIAIVFETTSTSATLSPSTVTNSGSTLKWTVTGDATGIYDANDPTIDLSGNTGTAIITITSADNLVGLTTIRLGSMNITSIDVSAATSLTSFWCFINAALTEIVGLENLTSLTELVAINNGLTTLNTTGLTLLNSIRVEFNYTLGSFDISTNTALTSLQCNSCGLTSLDISTNTALKVITASSNSLTVSEINNILLDRYANGVLTSTRTMTYASQSPAANPTATENTTNDVLDAYNALVSAGWSITGATPA